MEWIQTIHVLKCMAQQREINYVSTFQSSSLEGYTGKYFSYYSKETYIVGTY